MMMVIMIFVVGLYIKEYGGAEVYCMLLWGVMLVEKEEESNRQWKWGC